MQIHGSTNTRCCALRNDHYLSEIVPCRNCAQTICRETPKSSKKLLSKSFANFSFMRCANNRKKVPVPTFKEACIEIEDCREGRRRSYYQKYPSPHCTKFRLTTTEIKPVWSLSYSPSQKMWSVAKHVEMCRSQQLPWEIRGGRWLLR